MKHLYRYLFCFIHTTKKLNKAKKLINEYDFLNIVEIHYLMRSIHNVTGLYLFVECLYNFELKENEQFNKQNLQAMFADAGIKVFNIEFEYC